MMGDMNWRRQSVEKKYSGDESKLDEENKGKVPASSFGSMILFSSKAETL